MRKSLGLAILAGSLACYGADAATYPAIYSFGDSLSDAGNDFISSLGAIPPFPYFNGRFSNGLNWVDDLTAKLGLGSVATPSLSSGNDFAWGGAQTGTTIATGVTFIPSLDNQVDTQFKALIPSPTPGALYTLDIGANDILNAVAGLKAGSFSLNDLTTTFLNQAVANTVDAIHDLYADGMRSFLYYEVPDLALVPDYVVLGPQYAAEAGALAKDFNIDVLNGVQALDLSGLTVFDVPIFSSIDKIVANPGAFGLTNATDPCYSGNTVTPGMVCADPDQYLFWDGEHPTKIGHTLTAGLAFDILTGTTDPLTAPEPSTWAMMLIGFAGIGLASWRARRAGPTPGYRDVHTIRVAWPFQ
jgi:phospholipase/lecithinase/hemolysin